MHSCKQQQAITQLDVVTGNVIARNGDVLIVKECDSGAGGSVIFNDEVIVSLGDMTTIKRQLSMANDYDIGDVSGWANGCAYSEC